MVNEDIEKQAEELTEEEKEALKQYLGVGANVPDEKQNVHSFLNRIATSQDTTKTGYLKDSELGNPTLTLRTFKDLALISDKIIDNELFKEYYNAKAEILTATSLSRGGFLAKLAVLQKREMADVTKDIPEQRENKGWFKKRKKPSEEENVQ